MEQVETNFDSKDIISKLDKLHSKSKAHVIGITGAPGVGKSSLIDKLIKHIRKKNKSVGIIAIDPSSERSGGALLGDLDLALRDQTGLAISVADDSMNCVALGTGKSLEFERQLAHVIDYGT